MQPRTHALRAEALEPDQEERPRGDRGDRGDRKGGFRGRAPRGDGLRRPRDGAPDQEGAAAAPKTEEAPATEAL